MEELQLKSVIDVLGNKNIFDVIQKVIKLAAIDHPVEFMCRRDEIVQSLYGCEFHEDEKRRVAEVLRIKTILENNAADCKLVYELLKKLHKMDLSFKVVDAADIGNTVGRLRDHAAKQVKQIAYVIISSWIRKADRWVHSDEKMPDLHQEDEHNGVLNKKGGNLLLGNQGETTKSLKVRIKVIDGNKDTAGVEVLTSKRVLGKRSREEFDEADMLKKKPNLERKNTSFQKGQDEHQKVRIIDSKGTVKEKYEAARRKLRETTQMCEKKRRIQLLQSWEVKTPLPPESQLMKSTNKRFRR